MKAQQIAKKLYDKGFDIEITIKKYRKGMGPVFHLADGSKVFGIPGPYSFFLTNVEK